MPHQIGEVFMNGNGGILNTELPKKDMAHVSVEEQPPQNLSYNLVERPQEKNSNDQIPVVSPISNGDTHSDIRYHIYIGTPDAPKVAVDTDVNNGLEPHELLSNGHITINGTSAAQKAVPYTVVEQPIKEPRRMRVVTVGAGIAGLALLYKFRNIEAVDVQVYEKNGDVGGVWLENRYPGCSCDIPAHIYCYSFEGNPHWSRYYAEAEEIYDYYRSFAAKHNLYDRIGLRHKIRSAKWMSEVDSWAIEVEDLSTGRVFEESADVFINASGALNNYKWPEIKNLGQFGGKLVHSAAWDKDYSFEGKDVAIIGAGASAVQVLPRLQPVAKTLTSFNRSRVWIAADFVDTYAPDGRNTLYSAADQAKFSEDPEYLRDYRRKLTDKMCQIFNVFNLEHPAQKMAFANNTASMKRRLGDREDLAEKLLPNYPVGCRRTTPATGYLEALAQPNARLVTDTIVDATSAGLVTKDGIERTFDVIVCASGFDTSFKPAFPVTGLNGADLGNAWAETPKAYLSLAAAGFPNYFIMNGPNAPFANGSLVYGIECIADYIVQMVRKIQTERIRYVDVKKEAVDDWIEHRDEYMKRMVWSADCSSWYKDGKKDGPVIGPWAGSIVHFENALEVPRFEDYDIVYKQKNRFAFFGNGRSVKEARGEPLSYYITA